MFWIKGRGISWPIQRILSAYRAWVYHLLGYTGTPSYAKKGLVDDARFALGFVHYSTTLGDH